MHLESDGQTITIHQHEPIRELHLHVHGTDEELFTTHFNELKESVMSKIDALNTKVDTLTTAATTLGTKAVDLANVVNSEQAQISAAMDELRELAANNPALDAALSKLDAANTAITDSAASLAATAEDVKSTIPDLPPVEPPTEPEVPGEPEIPGEPTEPEVPGEDLSRPS